MPVKNTTFVVMGPS